MTNSLIEKNKSFFHKEKHLCTECNLCEISCPLVQWLGFKEIADASYENCFKCGHCVAICPTDAFRHEEITNFLQFNNRESEENAIYRSMLLRRSAREFRKEKIREEHWDKIINVVKYAPNSHNYEYINLIIIESKEIIKQLSNALFLMLKKLVKQFNTPILKSIYKKVLGKNTFEIFKKDIDLINVQADAMERGQDPILFNAPAVILFTGPKKESTCTVDANLAAQNVAILAPSLGIGTCFSSLLTIAFQGLYPAVHKIVKLPKDYKVFSALILGYDKLTYHKIPVRKDREIYFIK